MNDVTRLLREWTEGDTTALDRLTPVIYPELRTLARSYLRRWRQRVAVDTTEVVSELFIRLLAGRPAELEDRRHFYALSARIIRMALIDLYRHEQAERRGGRHEHVPLHEDLIGINATGPEMLTFDRALSDLERFDPELAELVNLRFVLGCTAAETADIAKLSKATVDRKVRLARAWLLQRLGPTGSAPVE